MHCSIERVNVNNYDLFDDMVFWRENGFEREPLRTPIEEQIKTELTNSNIYIYAARVDDRYFGWISLIYIPKAGKW